MVLPSLPLKLLLTFKAVKMLFFGTPERKREEDEVEEEDRERERKRDRQTDRQIDRQRQRE